MDEEHDPFNDPELRHPRARALMPDEDLWDCANDCAPFGSDDGNTAYYEFRRWRAEHPHSSLVACMDWILEGRSRAYTAERLLDERAIAGVAGGDEDAGLLGMNYGSVFTLDTSILSTALAQLADEGRIDAEAKPFARAALRRQLHPAIVATWGPHAAERRRLLEAAGRALEEA